MSIRVMTLVWDRFPGSGSELLSMLALADWCSDEGDSLHPSIARVASKIRSSESQARRLLHGLIEAGWLDVVGNTFGGAPGTTRQYHMNVAKLLAHPLIRQTPSVSATPSMDATPSTDDTPQEEETGGMGARDGSHGCAETGSTHDTQSIIRSISKPSKALVRKSPAREVFDYPGDFMVAWRTYPERYGSNNKRDAWKAWNARIRAGFTAAQIQKGVDAYRTHVVHAGKLGTEYVMMAATFFGPACKFNDDWPAHPPPDALPTTTKSAMRAMVEQMQEQAHGR